MGPEMIVNEATGLMSRFTRATADGVVYMDWRQFGSVNYGADIVFPSVIVHTTYQSGILSHVDINIIQEARFNEELPADAFAVGVPSGTNIFDHRSGGERPRFGKAPEGVDDVVAYVDERIAERTRDE